MIMVMEKDKMYILHGTAYNVVTKIVFLFSQDSYMTVIFSHVGPCNMMTGAESCCVYQKYVGVDFTEKGQN